MKKISKRVICAVLTAVFALSIVLAAAPAKAQAAVEAPKKMTFTGRKGYTGSIDVRRIPKGTQIDVTSVKSSNTSVATIYSVTESTYSNDVDWEANGYCYIYFTVQGAGTTKISYKIGSKKYTTKLTVKTGKESESKYTCPVDKFTISGVNGGKDLSSKLKKQSYVENMKLASTQKNGKVTVKAKKGWTIEGFYISDYMEDGSHSLSIYGINDTSATIDKLLFEKKSGVRHEVQVNLRKDDNSEYTTVWVSFN